MDTLCSYVHAFKVNHHIIWTHCFSVGCFLLSYFFYSLFFTFLWFSGDCLFFMWWSYKLFSPSLFIFRSVLLHHHLFHPSSTILMPLFGIHFFLIIFTTDMLLTMDIIFHPLQTSLTTILFANYTLRLLWRLDTHGPGMLHVLWGLLLPQLPG